MQGGAMFTTILGLTRHVIGYGVLLPMIVIGIVAQALVAGPLFGNRSLIPKLVFRAIAGLFGIRFLLDPGCSPIAPGVLTMFAFNHLARIDFACLYLLPDSALLMNALFFRMPVFGPVLKLFADSAGFVGTDQTLAGKAGDQAALATQIQKGRNVVLFPEGMQTDGKRVLRYSSGAADILYDPAMVAAFPALRQVRLQPVVLRVARIEGQDVRGQPEKWDRYTLTQRPAGIFVNMTRRAFVRRTVVEVLIRPAIDPADFGSAAEAMKAVQEVARAIVAPQQTRAMSRAQWRARIAGRDFSV